MKSAPVRVISNFLTSVECATWIEYINELEHTVPELFTVHPDKPVSRISLQFGEKEYEDDQARPALDVLTPKMRQAADQIFSRIVKETRSAFGDSSQLYPCIFWMAKQYPGSRVDPHEDTDGGSDEHIHYSSLVYLNTQQAGGQITFHNHNFTYSPQAGDLLVFDTELGGVHSVMKINEERYSLPVWMTRNLSFNLS
jgi:hypothetical protein